MAHQILDNAFIVTSKPSWHRLDNIVTSEEAIGSFAELYDEYYGHLRTLDVPLELVLKHPQTGEEIDLTKDLNSKAVVQYRDDVPEAVISVVSNSWNLVTAREACEDFDAARKLFLDNGGKPIPFRSMGYLHAGRRLDVIDRFFVVGQSGVVGIGGDAHQTHLYHTVQMPFDISAIETYNSSIATVCNNTATWSRTVAKNKGDIDVSSLDIKGIDKVIALGGRVTIRHTSSARDQLRSVFYGLLAGAMAERNSIVDQLTRWANAKLVSPDHTVVKLAEAVYPIRDEPKRQRLSKSSYEHRYERWEKDRDRDIERQGMIIANFKDPESLLGYDMLKDAGALGSVFHVFQAATQAIKDAPGADKTEARQYMAGERRKRTERLHKFVEDLFFDKEMQDQVKPDALNVPVLVAEY